MADDRDERFESSPATRLLDALGRGDLNAALLEFRPTTIVRTEDRSWSLQGEEQVLYGLEDALDLFPGIVFDSHARHIGHGRVIEEARVRDLGPLDADVPGDEDADPADRGDAGEHAAGAGAGGGGSLVLDRDHGKSETPRLNMPIRLTVLHDDQSVHEIILSFPRALLRAALGQPFDPLDMAVQEIQSAFVAPVGSGFSTYELGTKPVAPLEFAPPPPPEPAPVPVAETEPVAQQTWRAAPPLLIEEEEPPRRRAKLVVPLVVLLVGAIAGGTWWFTQGGTSPEADAKPKKPAHTTSQGDKNKPTKKPSASPSPTKTEPVVTKTPDKPTVTLKSDLAFPKNSAALSDAAKVAIGKLADQIRAAKLHGTIHIDGYTDNLGSAAHGLSLSQDRAQAVAQYLRSRLGSYRVDIVAVGHGEANPIASNDTEAGRQKNRRVTITLPDK
jgi:outer membrane protein OmpA-like peptidoglycan-associated protein